MKHSSILAAITVAVFGLFIGINTAFAQTEAPKYPDAPDWTLETQDGQEVSFSDFKGKPMLIHFWGT